MSSIESETKLRICTKCYKTLPFGAFRTLQRSTGRKSPECNSCRAARLRLKTEKDRKQALKRGLTQIRRSESAEKILAIVDSICERLGGISTVIRELVSLAQSDQTPNATKAKLFETIISMSILAEKIQLQEEMEVTPESIVRRLHERRDLAPILQKMFQSGEIDFDILDPPPENVFI